MNNNQLTKHCGKLRATYKTIEKQKNLISYDKDKNPKVREDYRCDKEKDYNFNTKMTSELQILYDTRKTYDEDCIKGQGIKTDKGHKTLINQYSNKLKKCKKIVNEQKPKSPKKIKKETKEEPTVKELTKILAENKVPGRSKLKTKEQKLNKVKELGLLDELIKDLSKMKI